MPTKRVGWEQPKQFVEDFQELLMSNYGVVNDDDNGRYVAQVTWEGEKKGLLWFSRFI